RRSREDSMETARAAVVAEPAARLDATGDSVTNTATDPTVIPPDEDTYPDVAIERGPRRRWILSYAKHGGVGAEFGVFRGHFAAEIADCLKPTRLFLVDPWTKSGHRFDWGDIPETNFNRLTTTQALNDALARMEPFRRDTQVEFVEDFSY